MEEVIETPIVTEKPTSEPTALTTPTSPVAPAVKTPKTPFLLLLGTVLLIVLVGTIFFVFSAKQKKLSPSIPHPTITPTIIAQPTGPIPPEGYVAKDTLCFTIFIPQENTAGQENSCDLIYDAGPDGSLGAHVSADLSPRGSVTEMIYAVMKSVTNQTSAQTQVKVGQYDGVEIRENLPNGINEFIHVFVYIPNKYTVSSIPVSGFEITKVFDKEKIKDQQKAFDILLSTWQWK